MNQVSCIWKWKEVSEFWLEIHGFNKLKSYIYFYIQVLNGWKWESFHFIVSGHGVHVAHSFNKHLRHLEVEAQPVAVVSYHHALAPHRVQASCSDVHLCQEAVRIWLAHRHLIKVLSEEDFHHQWQMLSRWVLTQAAVRAAMRAAHLSFLWK